ncbi:hypothetical protein C8A03DRAFT_31480 [Achaetomium macrosporum]|uniref:BZIP domain-containing protein n=1 Tax=Achaetomium macrosporum TaxID=79813 RepID=A0AAN7HE39_9PEZI|nr:hypothetical protein C8A03DRAFT_31480 [Achaetomium macrosporum]
MPVTPSPPDSAAAPSFASPDACYYYQLGGTVMAPPSPAHMLTPSQTASPESPRRKRTRTRRPSDTAIHTASRTRSPSTSPTAITTETTTPTAQRSETIAQTQSQSQHQAQGQDQANQATPTTQSQTRDRNRAAASRYRAKTQAAFAQLEAAEREGSVRRQSLLTCASQLRDELFQLKNELLRHAGCDCPLIQGYLSHAAEVASAGLRYSNGSQRLGQGEGLVGRSHLRT